MTQQEITIHLDSNAQRIRELLKGWGSNAIELGKELTAAQKKFPHKHRKIVGWEEWLRAEFNISMSHAAGFMRIFKRFGRVPGTRIIPGETLRLLSAAPKDIARKIIKRIEKGETVSRRKAKKLVAAEKAKKLPSPKQARQLARDTGKPVLASDNYLYFGATEEEERVINDRRNVVFGVRRAIETISALELGAERFLEYALPHQLLDLNKDDQIDRAASWLGDLVKAWVRYQRQIDAKPAMPVKQIESRAV